MQKLFIKNRKGQKIAVVVEKPEGNPRGLAFVMHGLGSLKESIRISAVAEVLLKNKYIAVRFDATNSIGESDGDYENATTTNYYEDLEDIIAWAKSQAWYQEPFVLVGSSLGGLCVGWYAENFPQNVRGLGLISTTISGKLSQEVYGPEKKEWDRTGWRIEKSTSKPGVILRLNWQKHMADRLKYDLLSRAQKLAMPVVLTAGDKDISTPLEHIKILYDILPGPKELHIIKGAAHAYREPHQLLELKEIFDKWIKSLD